VAEQTVDARLAAVLADRPVLPFTVHTADCVPVEVDVLPDGRVRFGPFRFDPLEALDASAALARAVQEGAGGG
jgi:hypothetical protein